MAPRPPPALDHSALPRAWLEQADASQSGARGEKPHRVRRRHPGAALAGKDPASDEAEVNGCLPGQLGLATLEVFLENALFE